VGPTWAEWGLWADQTSTGLRAAKSRLGSGVLAVAPEMMIWAWVENSLKASAGLPHSFRSWERFLTGLKDPFLSVNMDVGLQLRHGLSYGY
jgi:hypothetical protein